MAKRTAIIDIGSNSISLVIYEKSSRYAFHLIEKLRSRVRIGEGAYEHGGFLSDEAMQKAYDTLKDYMHVIRSLKCRKVLAVATSALRDAPNRKLFLSRVKKELKLGIKVIDGEKEAYLGAVAAINLLPKIDDAITIDIGGGSTELALIRSGKIVKNISLDIGTVRLKELFYDKKRDFSEVREFIEKVLNELPKDFESKRIIGIGGTIRALSSAILKDSNYPLDSLHAFRYDYRVYKEFIENLSKIDVLQLKDTSISKSRYDTIREGSAIFAMLCRRLKAEDIITSKAGVREGVYLTDILRTNNHRFPHNFNISIKNLVDRFAIYGKNISFIQKVADKLYLQTCHIFDIEYKYRELLQKASRLLLITRRLNIYSNSDMSFGFLLENLNFSISHEDKILIALILKYAHQKSINEKEIDKFQQLLPDKEVIKWLSFILSLTLCLNKNKLIQKLDIKYNEKTIHIDSQNSMFLSIECIKKLKKPAPFAIIINKAHAVKE